jgi:hypothetical protein
LGGEERAEQSDRMNLVEYMFEDTEYSPRGSWNDVCMPGLVEKGQKAASVMASE